MNYRSFEKNHIKFGIGESRNFGSRDVKKLQMNGEKMHQKRGFFFTNFQILSNVNVQLYLPTNVIKPILFLGYIYKH